MSDPIIERLDRLIALQADALDDRRLWSAADIGRYVGKSARFILERAACRPDFPTSIRILGGHRRWEPSEIKEWVRRQRSSKPVRKLRRSRVEPAWGFYVINGGEVWEHRSVRTG